MLARKNNAGFTLIELITTMVLIAIIATSVSKYLGTSAELIISHAEREQLIGQGRFIIERMNREVRNAAPNSARVAINATSQCLEFTPIITSGLYENAPSRVESNNSFDVYIPTITPQERTQILGISNARVLIFPTAENDIYNDTEDANATVVGISEVESNLKFTLTLQAQHTFPQHSPDRRFYIVDQPVSYCIRNQQIRRYSAYGFQSDQPTAETILGNGTLMAENIANIVTGQNAFSSAAATLTRNAVVNLLLVFNSARDSTETFFNHEIHIPNIP